LSGEAETVLNQVKNLEFEQQITLFRNLVSPMGADSITASQDPKTGL